MKAVDEPLLRANRDVSLRGLGTGRWGGQLCPLGLGVCRWLAEGGSQVGPGGARAPLDVTVGSFKLRIGLYAGVPRSRRATGLPGPDLPIRRGLQRQHVVQKSLFLGRLTEDLRVRRQRAFLEEMKQEAGFRSVPFTFDSSETKPSVPVGRGLKL